MSQQLEQLERIVVVGDDALAREVAEAVDHQAELELIGRVGAGEAIPGGTGFVLCLAGPEQRGAAIERALEAGLPVATLPLSDTRAGRRTLSQGTVVQVSPLRGYVALETLRSEVQRGALGTPYGIFAAHRFGEVSGEEFGERGNALLQYVYELIGEPVEMVQTTVSPLFSPTRGASFIIARAASGLLLTIEFAASLGLGGGAEEQILVEATGSDNVLRAEPTRQAVLVSGKSGTREQPWWISRGPGFVAAALSAIRSHDTARELGFLDFLAAVRQATDANEAVSVG